MATDARTISQAKRLLDELVEHRQKLLDNLLHPQAAGNIEEEAYDRIITRLGAVQGSIEATRELLARSEDADGTINYNHLHQSSGGMISGTAQPINIGDLRDAIAPFPDDAEIAWGTCSHGEPLAFYRFKVRGENVLGIEFS